MQAFKDNFSGHAAIYARHRPVYPRELFAWLSTLSPAHALAWDCATGNGQCAVRLAEFYTTVFASDPSEAQIAHALPDERVTYKVEPAEQCSLPGHSVDLLTVAQALHWFDQERFYRETKRVLKPGGIIAVIAYINPRVSAAIDALTDHLHDVVLKDYWLPENRLVEAGYATLPFPFKPVAAPAFTLERSLDREAFMGHISTWSAVQRFIARNGQDPMPAFAQELEGLWPADTELPVSWPLILKVGRV